MLWIVIGVLVLIIIFLCVLVYLHARHNAVIEKVNGERIDIISAQYYELEALRRENRQLRGEDSTNL